MNDPNTNMTGENTTEHNRGDHAADTMTGAEPDGVRARGRRAWRTGRRKEGHMSRYDHHIHHHFDVHSRGGPGGSGHGRQRARRGAVVRAALMLLDERPMHGYELITEMADRSGGRWRPSPGTIYPALHRMEERGLVTADDVDAEGKRRFSLTDAGRARLAEQRDAHDEAPWNDPGTGRRGDLRGKLAELVGQVRQIGRFGTPEQADRAGVVLDTAKRELYAILATEPDDPAPTADDLESASGTPPAD